MPALGRPSPARVSRMPALGLPLPGSVEHTSILALGRPALARMSCRYDNACPRPTLARICCKYVDACPRLPRVSVESLHPHACQLSCTLVRHAYWIDIRCVVALALCVGQLRGGDSELASAGWICDLRQLEHVTICRPVEGEESQMMVGQRDDRSGSLLSSGDPPLTVRLRPPGWLV